MNSENRLLIHHNSFTLQHNKVQFLSVIFAVGVLLVPVNVYAAEQIGSKNDKGFELCMSKCVFKETKPPPVGSRCYI